MTGNAFLIVFLIVDVFFLGLLAAFAIRHAYAHLKPAKPESVTDKPPMEYLNNAAKERLLHDAQAQFQEVVRHSATHLQHDLNDSVEQINEMIKKFATDIVESEMQRYRQELERLRQQTDEQFGGLRQEVAKHETELKAKLAQEMDIEKQKLIKQIDTKLADAMGSFLTEALQHNIDLGNQTEYLISLLEENKAEFIKEVGNEDQTAR